MSGMELRFRREIMGCSTVDLCRVCGVLLYIRFA